MSDIPGIPTRQSYEGTGGWQDGRIGQAYDLISQVAKDRGEKLFKHPLLDEIELYDRDFLPEGLRERGGVIEFECISCGHWSEWNGDVADFEPGVSENRCGGSPRCCP
ncbi:hypothetical protein OSJ57_23350 [Sphingomonas sp. HH69]